MAASPANLVGLSGESPPTQPSSYEDSGRIHPAWVAQRPLMGSSPASPSPPASARRLLGSQMAPQYQPVTAHAQPPAPAAQLRSSVPSHHPHAPAAWQAPPPYLPQPHFFRAPELDLTLAPHSGIPAGEKGYFFGLDRLPSAQGSRSQSDRVVLAGYEGGLEVYAINKRGLEPVARLKGLHGGVYHAKILPWTVSAEETASFPLVAVVIHGPVVPSGALDNVVNGDSSRRDHGAASSRAVPVQLDPYSLRQGSLVHSYRTAIHVYSLKTNKLVDVLLEAPKTPISSAIPLPSPMFQPPAPTGSFTVRAEGGIVAVCSGTTGECWVFRQLLELQNSHVFACAGKVWTCLQQSVRGGDQADEGDRRRLSGPTHRPTPQTPIIAIHGSWIAYCPAAPSSHITLRAQVPVPFLGKAPGLSSATPPQLPPVSSTVDLPISETFVNKVMRETTQELIHGARWVGQQGMQAWNSYWNRPVSPPAQQQPQSPPQSWSASASPSGASGQFPPTHGAATQAVSKDPGLISILDAETLATSASPHPLATFAPPTGCSFLSFSPSGLSLFTASSKGDVQTVWDLLRILYTQSSPLQSSLPGSDGPGSRVRQVAQFSRMTIARIVDVAWTEPSGDRIAMVTERGTVHLLDMPFSSFMWPPPRRRKAGSEKPAESSDAASSAVSIASGAFEAAYQAARPFVTRSRRSSNTGPSRAGNMLRDSAAHGGRVLATTITTSLGKTGTAISQLRHTGENRVSLPSSTGLPMAGCVSWVKARKTHVLYAAGGGLVRAFHCRPALPSAPKAKGTARRGRYKDLVVPPLPDEVVPPAVRQILDHGTQDEILDLSDREMDAGNVKTPSQGHQRAPSANCGLSAAIPHTELESSAPYQPFYTDRRVGLYEVTSNLSSRPDPVSAVLEDAYQEGTPSGEPKERSGSQEAAAIHWSRDSGVGSSVWAFGQAIPAVKRDLGQDNAQDDETSRPPEDYMALPPSAMERVMQYDNEEQIVVTTRRRRGGARGGDADADGFFEDDCEVLDFADQRV